MYNCLVVYMQHFRRYSCENTEIETSTMASMYTLFSKCLATDLHYAYNISSIPVQQKSAVGISAVQRLLTTEYVHH